jgi:hypothetical protein
VDSAAFGRALADLGFDDVRAIAADLRAASRCAADALAHTRATLVIEHTLRLAHRMHDANTSAFFAATAVQTIAERAAVVLPDDDVTCVARAAAQYARGLVVAGQPGVGDALAVLGRGWERLESKAPVRR